ncbi:class I SAM-dependent methyltransferase [Runella limosa]|uniref:class I SAM-dependent methyltransferase n=1 Tax=Runella limosa TaxID=370978 RepID=UPI0003F4D5B7|nr:class I SAM-dependent methyltransferase [Runella limosa]MCA0231015.1 class I SAM-dependent methyltransferase [Bacteroidota bacterium]
MSRIKEIVKATPLIGDVARFIGKYRTRVPAGHFYSPIVSVDEIRKREEQIYPTPPPRTLPGIDLREEAQVALMQTFASSYFGSVPFTDNPQEGFRYYFVNKYFIHADATTLHCMMRHFKPKHIIEAGSGFSSAVMLDTNERFLNQSVKFTFIEPYPDRLYSLLTPADRQQTTIFEKTLQDIPVEYFEQLGENDILFIDSTHVSKTGSDVNYFLFEIFPRLKPGVIVHVHDVFYPFEYPKAWVIDGNGRFGWNEAYMMRAFLMYQNQFEVLFYNDFLQTFHSEWLSKHMPTYATRGRGSSIWLRKTK